MLNFIYLFHVQPVDYTGGRDLESLTKFLEACASNGLVFL
jgi:hypothetical protein